MDQDMEDRSNLPAAEVDAYSHGLRNEMQKKKKRALQTRLRQA
jgi:hypothetical protein